jgi:cephalosporin-C deacetylase
MNHLTQKTRTLFFLLLCVAVSFAQESIAQIPKQYLEISVTPDKPDWRYKVGENVEFIVSVTQSGRPVAAENVRYFVKEEKMNPIKEGALQLTQGKATISSVTMKNPGFLRCEVFATVDGKEYRGLGTAAFEPENIKPTIKIQK